MDYHYGLAANETKEEREKRMMERKAYDIYVPLRAIFNDLNLAGTSSGRRRVFLPDEDIEVWKEFFDWLFEKYGKMLRNSSLRVYMLVGTLKVQRNKLLKEIENKRSQLSIFPDEVQEEIEKLEEEVKKMNIFENICYDNIDRFFEFMFN